MNQGTFALVSIAAAALMAGGILSFLATRTAHAADEDPPLNLARDGFFYVGGKTTTVNGKSYVVGQMYVEMRIPANQWSRERLCFKSPISPSWCLRCRYPLVWRSRSIRAGQLSYGSQPCRRGLL